jgi:RadC-like JAB domain
MTYRLKTFRVQFVAEPAEFPRCSSCRSSEDVERLARAIYATLDADKEHFLLLAMNIKNRVNGFKVVSTGNLTASLVHPAKYGERRFTFAQLPSYSFTTTQAANLHRVKRTRKSHADSRKLARCSVFGYSITWYLVTVGSFRSVTEV